MKKTWIRKSAAALAAVMGIVSWSAVPVSADWNKTDYDMNDDGVFTEADEELMFHAIVDNQEGIDKKLDVNGNGRASLEDWYVLKIGNDAFGIGGRCLFENLTNRYEQVLGCAMKQEKKDDTLQVQLELNDDRSGFLDYAVVYDTKKLKLESADWTTAWKSAFEGESNSRAYSGMYDKKQADGYVLFAGYREIWKQPANKDAMATLTFSYVDADADVKEDDITLVPYATERDDSVESLKEERIVPKTELFVYGDADNDGYVELKDAQTILKSALKIKRLDASLVEKCDLDGDEKITLKDAQKALKLALRIDYFERVKFVLVEE